MTTRRSTIDTESIFKLLELGDYLLPYTIRAVCLLGVADHLVDGPVTMRELAEETKTHEPTLRKALEYLATRGIFELVGSDAVGLTPMADLLRGEHPYSARDIFRSPVACTRAMEGLDHAIATGEAAFDAVHGVSMWEHLAANPEDGVAFDRVMSGVTARELMAIVHACDWPRFATVVDQPAAAGQGYPRDPLRPARRRRGGTGVLRRGRGHRPRDGRRRQLPDRADPTRRRRLRPQAHPLQLVRR